MHAAQANQNLTALAAMLEHQRDTPVLGKDAQYVLQRVDRTNRSAAATHDDVAVAQTAAIGVGFVENIVDHHAPVLVAASVGA